MQQVNPDPTFAVDEIETHCRVLQTWRGVCTPVRDPSTLLLVPGAAARYHEEAPRTFSQGPVVSSQVEPTVGLTGAVTDCVAGPTLTKDPAESFRKMPGEDALLFRFSSPSARLPTVGWALAVEDLLKRKLTAMIYTDA
jgi:hypothetical protein